MSTIVYMKYLGGLLNVSCCPNTRTFHDGLADEQ